MSESNSRNGRPHDRQPVQGPAPSAGGRLRCDLLDAIRSHLEHVERLTTGDAPRDELARHLSIIRGAAEHGLRDDVEEIRNLDRLPAAHLVDAELSKHRAKVLAKYLPGGAHQADGSYERTHGSELYFARVNAGDAWIAAVDDDCNCVSGRGLTSLVAYLAGESLSEAIERLAPKLGLSANV